MSCSCNLGVNLCNRIRRSTKPLHGLNTPAAERLDGERDQASSRKSPRGIASMLPVCRTSSSCVLAGLMYH